MKRSRDDEDQAITAVPVQAAAPAAVAPTEAAPAEAQASVLPPLPSSLAHATLWYYDDVHYDVQQPRHEDVVLRGLPADEHVCRAFLVRRGAGGVVAHQHTVGGT